MENLVMLNMVGMINPFAKYVFKVLNIKILDEMKTKYIILFCCMLASIFITSSCKEKEEVLEAPRLFKPQVTTIDNSIDNQLTVTWLPAQGVVQYQIDLGLDSTFVKINQSLTVDSNVTSVIFDGLMAASRYYIRIKAINTDATLNSKYSVFWAATSSIFFNNPDFILDNSFIAKWIIRGLPVTKIKISLPSDTGVFPLVKEVDVTESEAANGLKTISGLKGDTRYIVAMYSGTLLRGIGIITTKTSILNGIDLRDLDPLKRDSIFNDAMMKAPDGSIIVLKRGVTYNLTVTQLLTKSITITSGYDFIPDLATISFSRNFQFADNCVIGTVVFKDVKLIGATNGAYVFQSNGVGSKIENVTFDGCRISTFRGVFRLQNSEIVNNLTFNNCVIDSLRDYALTRIYQTTTNIVRNITLTNSTIYNAQRVFINTKFLPNTPTTVTIENCTFYNSPVAGGYIIDYGSDATLLASISIKKCIFGSAGTLPVPPATATLGFRVASSMSLDADASNYVTSDFYIAGIPLATIYNGTSKSLFKYPAKKDFTIIDAAFSGRKTAGDPRWR